MFENQRDSTSSDVRGRSPSENGAAVNPTTTNATTAERPLSKIRSSFVSVEPSHPGQPSQPAEAITDEDVTMEIDPEDTKAAYGKRASTADLRRESFSLDESADSSAISQLKKTISQETERRASIPAIQETIPEAAIEATPATTTPAVEAKDYLAAGEHQQQVRLDKDNAQDEDNGKQEKEMGSKLKTMTLLDDPIPPENPDKPVSAAQEEPGPMQPSDPKEQATISLPITNERPTTPEHASTLATSTRRPSITPLANSTPRPRRESIAPAEASPRPRRGSMAPASATPRARRESVAISQDVASGAPAVPKSEESVVVPKPEESVDEPKPQESNVTSEPVELPVIPEPQNLTTSEPQEQSIASEPQEPSIATKPQESVAAPKSEEPNVASKPEESTPAEPTSISEAKEPAVEDPKPAPSAPERSVTPTPAKKPSTATTPSKASPAAKSSAKSSSSTLSPKAPLRKASRQSLTSATAASQARAKEATAAVTKERSSKPAATAASRTLSKSPSTTTHPAKVSSRLTAPTAASAARQDAHAAPKPAASSRVPPTTHKPTQPSTNGSKMAPRTSLAARPASTEKKHETRTTTRAPDEGFLARMMRPTASSANKAHERPDVKSPPRRTPSVLKKSAADSKPKAPKFEKTAHSSSAAAKTNGTAKPASTEKKVEDAAAGASTPQQSAPASDDTPNNTGLEATPAFNAETIR